MTTVAIGAGAPGRQCGRAAPVEVQRVSGPEVLQELGEVDRPAEPGALCLAPVDGDEQQRPAARAEAHGATRIRRAVDAGRSSLADELAVAHQVGDAADGEAQRPRSTAPEGRAEGGADRGAGLEAGEATGTASAPLRCAAVNSAGDGARSAAAVTSSAVSQRRVP